MNPVDFAFTNRMLLPAQGYTDEEMPPLPVFSDDTVCISAWKPTPEELAALNAGQPLYLVLLTGGTQPPVKLTTTCPVEYAGGVS
jgi:hypothetical protein